MTKWAMRAEAEATITVGPGPRRSREAKKMVLATCSSPFWLSPMGITTGKHMVRAPPRVRRITSQGQSVRGGKGKPKDTTVRTVAVATTRAI